MSMKDDMKNIGNRISGKKSSTIDAAAIRELADLLKETGLTEIEIDANGTRLRVSRQATVAAAPQAMAAPAAAPAAGAAPAATGPNPNAVPSPMVGTVYVAPEPGKPPFIKVGDTVTEGQTLFIVEAMKTMNPILSPRSGKVTEICITDAQPVEFNQALAVIS